MEFFGLDSQDNKPPSTAEQDEKKSKEILRKMFWMNSSTSSCLKCRQIVMQMTLSETILYATAVLFILCDITDAVHQGNGDWLAILHKQLYLHFKLVPGFNLYATEMLISVVQNMVFIPQHNPINGFGQKQQLERWSWKEY